MYGKSSFSKFLIAGLVIVGCATAQAKSNSNTKTPAQKSSTAGSAFKQRMPASEAMGTPQYWWIGLASDASVVNTQVPALSALFPLSEKVALQTYGSITSSNPFIFGVGGNLKCNLIGDLMKGLHIGGGAAVGLLATSAAVVGATGTTSASTFYVNLNGILGFHFHLIDRILFSIDGGAHLAIAGGSATFSLGGNSNHLGLSVLYRL